MDDLEKQNILLRAFEADENLYPWLKNYYWDCCSQGDVMIHAMLRNLHDQKTSTPEQLKYIWHLYTTFTDAYKIDAYEVDAYKVNESSTVTSQTHSFAPM
jgi:hypothetical protein